MKPKRSRIGAVIALTCAVAAAGCSDNEPEQTRDYVGFSGMTAVINEASGAMLDSVLGREVEKRWRLPKSAKNQLASARRVVRGFGDAEVLLTVVELEALRTEGNPSHVRATAAVFPDGGIRWLTVAARSGPMKVEPSFAIGSLAPQIDGGVHSLIELLSSEDCEALPMLKPADVSSLPAKIRSKFRDGSSLLPGVCAAMSGQADGWMPRVDDLTIIVGNDERAGLLSTRFDLSAGKLRLAAPKAAAP